MDALNSVEWTVVGPVIDKRAATLATLLNSGSRVDELGFLTNTVNEVMRALNDYRAEEDRAWDEKRKRDAEELSIPPHRRADWPGIPV